jgi:hypothetical protein
MPAADWRVAFFRHAFVRHAPQRYAVMLALDAAVRLGQKYQARRGALTDALLAQHLAGAITLAAPAAVDGRAHLLPLDIDTGGMLAITTLIAAARQRDLWAFGQYCPRPGLADADQRGYVWLPFDQTIDSARLQALGAQLIAASSRPGGKVESRASHAATRLPLARHRHTGRFGELVIDWQTISIDQDPTGALAVLCRLYRENASAGLPERPASAPQSHPRTAARGRNSAGITIEAYNQTHDLAALLRCYGAKPTGRRSLYYCPFHGDTHASLSVYTQRGQQYCRCFSAHSDCPLAQHRRNDAFNVYCIGEGIDAKVALRRLNGRE